MLSSHFLFFYVVAHTVNEKWTSKIVPCIIKYNMNCKNCQEITENDISAPIYVLKSEFNKIFRSK